MTTFPDAAADRNFFANPAENARGALPLIDALWRGNPHFSATREESRKASARSGDAGAAEPATAARRAIAAMFATSALVIAGAGALMIFMLQFGFAKPLAGLTAAIELALADPSQPPLPGLNRKNELGRIARAFECMRAAAVAQSISYADEIVQRLREAATAEAAAQAERARAAHAHSLAVTRIAEALGALAGGNLNGSISEVLSGDYAQVSADFNRATAVLAGAMRAVSSSTQAIRFCARDMSTASQDISQRAQAQASIAEETVESIARLAIDVEAVAEDAEPFRRAAAAIDMQTKASSAALGEAGRELAAFTRLAQQLTLNIGLIEDIAVHTNLLAINAGVEAARAGEAGRGTAVVATEMRAVAQRSAQAAKELKDLFKTSLGGARRGVERIEYAGETLAQLATQTADIDVKAKAFGAGAAGRSATVDAIRENLDRIGAMAESHADTALAVASASDSLDQLIGRLLILFGRFRFGENQSPALASAGQLRAPEAATWATHARSRPRKASNNSDSTAA